MIGPGPTLRPELVASHDLDADPGLPLLDEGVVHRAQAPGLTVDAPPEPRALDHPVEQPRSGMAERLLERLSFAGRVAVQ
ncbi:hypothetical protein [Brevibacterium album]|uniref:hypothetical protein n=1 Tax=Brevibacterium album TaxID=417948 RepID=UPI00316ABD2E